LKRRGQQQAQPDGQNSSSWLTTFNDLVTLLMVFFVLLFTMSTIDSKKMSDFQYALQSGLGILEAGQRVGIKVKQEQPVRDMSHIKTQAEGRLKPEQKQSMRKIIEKALGSLDDQKGIRVFYTEQGARLRFEDAILFDFGRADINPAGFSFLDRISSVIHQIQGPVRIEGHTDDVPIHTKRFPSNWELSTARAVNVVKYFVESCNIKPQRLSAVGYGQSKPLFSNDSAEHRAKNRRVEIVLVREELK
jgi:chemotaxis protein MotB